MHDHYEGKNRRKSFRADKPVGVDIIECNGRECLPKWDHEIGVNIGSLGIMLKTDKKILEKTLLVMKIMIPDDKQTELILAKGRAVWVRENIEQGKKQYYVGVSFTDIDPRDEERLNAFVGNPT